MVLRNAVMLDDGTKRIYEALIRGELTDEDLSARRIAKILGKTTGAVYHHYGSLDRFLFEVSQRGYVALKARLEEVFHETGDIADLAQAFVEFGLDHRELYPLMFERRYDWDGLREAGTFDQPIESSELLASMLCLLDEAGSPNALADARLLMAGLHGLVSLAASGRANVGALTTSDRDVAIAGARDLANRICDGGRS